MPFFDHTVYPSGTVYLYSIHPSYCFALLETHRSLTVLVKLTAAHYSQAEAQDLLDCFLRAE